MELRVSVRGRSFRANADRAYDLSIPLEFDASQPNFFDAPRAAARPLVAGRFVGDVREGGSCNCATYSLTPHCNGTHTECVGHVTSDRIGIRELVIPSFMRARLVTLAPTPATSTAESSNPSPRAADELITRDALQRALGSDTLQETEALIVRTTPNPPEKRYRRYGPTPAPAYLSAEFMQSVVSHGIEHLIVDLPSLDRAEDEGRLTAHRLFFGLPAGSSDASKAQRRNATVTELAYIADAIPDGWYALNLQVAPFMADAAPSRPLLLPLEPV